MAVLRGGGIANVGGTLSSGGTTVNRAPYSDYNKIKTVAKNIANSTGLTSQLNTRRQNQQDYYNNQKKTGGGVASAQEVPATSGGGGYSQSSGTDEILEKIKSLLNEQKTRADELINSQYNQAIENSKLQERLDSEKANLQKATLDRRLGEMYGNSITGQGLSNRVRSDSNWYNAIANIQRDLSNRNATALQEKSRGLANNASTLSQGWYNYVLPIYTNRQQNLDDLDYRKYIANLFRD